MNTACLHIPSYKFMFRLGLASALFLLAQAADTWAATKTWSGAGTDSYWNTGANWGGTPPANWDTLTFTGSNRKDNTNDITGLSIGVVTNISGGWRIASTSPITKTNDFVQNVSGTNTWAADTILVNTGTATTKVTGSDYGARLEISGQLSGAGALTKNNGANGRGSLALLCPSNTFSGAVNLGTGPTDATKFAPGGSPSSFGQGTGTILIGSTGSGYPTTFNYVGTEDSTTDRKVQLYTRDGQVPLVFNNNSPSNANLTFTGGWEFKGYIKDLSVSVGGRSKGTNTIAGIAQTGTNSQGFIVNGPGTWVVDGAALYTGPTTVNSGTLALGPSGTLVSSKLTVRGGASFDVGAVSGGFPLGSSSQQTLWIGYNTSNTAPSDIFGSLSLGFAGVLNIGGAATAGTLGVSSNLSLAAGNTGSIQMDLGSQPVVGGGTNDLILVGGDLDVSGGATLSINPYQGTLLTGTPYTLVKYSGNFIGDVANLTVPAPARTYRAELTTASKELRVTFSPSGTPAAILTWQGSYGTDWSAGPTPNWLNNGTNDVFTQGDAVLFNDAASMNWTIDVGGAVFPSAMTVDTASVYTFQGAGSIGGSAIVTKRGTGAAILSSANSLSGTAVVSAGSLVAGNISALGTASVVLGDSATGTNDVGFLFTGAANVPTPVLVSTNGTGLALLGRYSGNSGGYNGAITIQRSICFTNDGPYSGTTMVLLNGNISGQGDVTLVGSGFHKWQNSNSFSGDLTLRDPGIVLQVSAGTGIPDTATVNISTGAVFVLYGAEAIDALNGAGVVRPIQNNFVLTVGAANGSGVFSGFFSNSTENAVFATVGLRKTGTGTQIMTGDNSLASGNTTVAGGVLAINNATGSGTPLGAINVQAGGTLAGNGTISSSSNNITVNGMLSVGNAGDAAGAVLRIDNASYAAAPGTLIVNTGTIAVDVFSGAGAGDNTAIPVAADHLTITCAAQLNIGSSLTVANPKGMTAWAVGDKWKIINWSSAPTGTFGSLNLPNLGRSLTWDISALYTSGVIAVVTRPAIPPISYSFQNNALTLTWPGTATLQCAPLVIGVYTNIPGATSPFVITNFAEPALFYRLYFPW